MAGRFCAWLTPTIRTPEQSEQHVSFSTPYICVPMQPDARHLKRTAIHEAGHAVTHYLERVPFESFTILAVSVTGIDGKYTRALAAVAVGPATAQETAHSEGW
jgi:hypothetical protein